MSAVVNIITDAILKLSADFGYVAPHTIDIVEVFVTVIPLVFLTTQLTQTRRFEEGYHVYPWFQNNLPENRIIANK